MTGRSALSGRSLRCLPAARHTPLSTAVSRPRNGGLLAIAVPPCGYRFARVAAGHPSAACGRGALAARRLAEGLAGCCLGLPSFLRSSLFPVTLPWPMPAPGIAALTCSPGPCAALRAAACARVPLPALALRPQCTGRRTQERRRQQSPELPQCPQTTPQQRALNLGIRLAWKGSKSWVTHDTGIPAL